MPDIWTEICNRLSAGQTLAAATIAMEDGSTPRSAGSKMLVDRNGLLFGTVGGGLGEATTIDAARDALADGRSRLLPIDMSGTMMAGADLVCGGRLNMFVQVVEPKHLDVFQNLRRRIGQRLDSYLITPTEGAPEPVLLYPEGGGAGEIPGGLAETILDDPPASAGLCEWEGRLFFVEAVGARTRLILAGGGHVSRATAEMATLVDFDVFVQDDRPEFVAPERFPWIAPERLAAVPEFANCFSGEILGDPIDAHCFLAILTRGHAHDYHVLVQALRTPAGYIGMIGSRRKRDQIYARLLADGFAQADLDRIHSPIGLAIGAETPAEIAVSIVGELVSVRAAAKRESRQQ